MKTYLVLECHPGFAVLIDEEGRFVKACNLNYTVGQTVEDIVLMHDEQKEHVSFITPVRAIGAAAVVGAAFFFAFNWYSHSIAIYSHVYLSINPDVAMNLNRKGEVLELVAGNPDGEKLIAGYESKGKDQVEVAKDLVERSLDMEYLTDGGTISFTIDTPDEALFVEYGTALRSEMEAYVSSLGNYEIEIYNYAETEVKYREDIASPVPTSNPTPVSTPTATPTLVPAPVQQQPAPVQPAPVYPSGDSGYSGYDNDSGYD